MFRFADLPVIDNSPPLPSPPRKGSGSGVVKLGMDQPIKRACVCVAKLGLSLLLSFPLLANRDNGIHGERLFVLVYPPTRGAYGGFRFAKGKKCQLGFLNADNVFFHGFLWFVFSVRAGAD